MEAGGGGPSLSRRNSVRSNGGGSRLVLQKVPSEGSVSIVSYSRPSLMTFVSRTQFHVERPWGQRPFSIVS